jgi:hypothetical protein
MSKRMPSILPWSSLVHLLKCPAGSAEAVEAASIVTASNPPIPRVIISFASQMMTDE